MAKVEKMQPKTATATDTIETTLGGLVDGQQALERLIALPLPMRAAYHLEKLARLVRAEIKIFNTRREALIKQLGEERDPTPQEVAMSGGNTGKITAVKAEHTDAFHKQVTELREQAVTITWRPFEMSALGDDFKITASDLLALDALVSVALDGSAMTAAAKK